MASPYRIESSGELEPPATVVARSDNPELVLVNPVYGRPHRDIAEPKPAKRLFQVVLTRYGGRMGSATPRNAGCPCGSGLKFKACCKRR